MNDRCNLLARSWLGVFTFFLAFLGVNPLVAQSRDYYFGRTKETTPVIVSMKDKDELLHFKIPKVFMTFSDNWKGGVQDFIVLETIFPSMAPLSATRTSISGPDVLIITVHSHDSGDFAVSSIVQRYKSNFLITTGRVDENFEIYVERWDLKNLDDNTKLVHEYFMPLKSENDKQTDVYLRCLRYLGRLPVGCTGYCNFGKNLTVNFQFRRSEFKRWPEFRDATLKLLSSLRVEAAN